MSKKALVVDADYFFVEFVSELLEKRGYTVTVASRTREKAERIVHGFTNGAARQLSANRRDSIRRVVQ